MEINLDKVPKKYEGLDGTELAISESQERMAVVLAKDDLDKFLALARAENLEAIAVAQVTDTRRMIMTWRGKVIVDISREFLNTNGVTQKTSALIQAPDSEDWFYKNSAVRSSVAETLLETLKDLNVCSQKGLSERFDSTIGKGTVLMPFGGKTQLTPIAAMAARLPVERGVCDDMTVMSYGYSPALSKWSPFHGAVYSIVEALAKLTAAGADITHAWLSLQEYFERLHKDPRRWGKPAAAVLGAMYAQEKLGIPAIGGKDSMSGSFMELDVPPTLVAFAVAVSSADKVLSPEFKETGSSLYLIAPILDNDLIPYFDDLKKKYAKICELNENGKILSAQPIGIGGIAVAIAKMAFGNGIGAVIETETDNMLFKPEYGAIIIECKQGTDITGIGAKLIGRTVAEKTITLNGSMVSIDQALQAWQQPLDGVFPAAAKNSGIAPKVSYLAGNRKSSRFSIASPRVFIPVFPGTNCEYDTVRSFENTGAICEVAVVRNLSSADIEETIARFADSIKQSQIILIPGGFSGGDEPDGSGKFIATVFRNLRIKDAVTELLEIRDGLILGICNGFQALIKLGLVPFGRISDIEPDYPTLTFNKIGRHVSQIARTRIASNLSPWLMYCNTGEVYNVAISHGEGRFVASEETLKELAEKGQIATQYTDPDGNPTMDGRFNSNGSTWAIEGITSPDGRVFGKMGHIERYAPGLFKNVPGNYDMRVFQAGVDYFK